MSSREAADAAAFARHAEDDAQLREGDGSALQQTGMSFTGRVVVFLVFPLFMGTMALLIAYLQKMKNPEDKLDFDADFIFPFLLALSLSVVVALQTRGFTKRAPTPVLQWPKVRRKKKIVHKQVVVDDDGEQVERDKKND